MAMPKWMLTALLLSLSLLLLFTSSQAFQARKLASGGGVRAVNLGGWLVLEEWIKYSLFSSIPQDELLDGTQIQLKSLKLGTYVCAEDGGGQNLVVNRQYATGWETLTLWRTPDGQFQFRVFFYQFVSAENGGGSSVMATRAMPEGWETFTITRDPNDRMRVHIKAFNGMYLQAENENQLTADYSSPGGEPGWDDNNAATFELTIVKSIRGEYQLANFLGPTKAAQVFQEHRDTFVTINDFNTLSSLGINAVRIPVGWWIAGDPNPPAPFVSGSLQALDNAFKWASQSNMKIIVDLHAAPGSQNGQDHSATRDGIVGWAFSQDNIQQSLDAIEFLTKRYANNPTLLGIDLLNEPHQPNISVDAIKNYYIQGYNIVRKYSASAYVLICQLLGDGSNPSDLVDLGIGRTNVVLELHYYNLFYFMFGNMTVQENIDYVKTNRQTELQSLNQNGLLLFIGEWTNNLDVPNMSQQDFQNFGAAQVQVFDTYATFGWAYWNFKIEDPNNVHWDFVRSVQQQFILQPSGGW